jgi:L-ascorbate metabolism protein UlaG (beta-lactamase superfamily)
MNEPLLKDDALLRDIELACGEADALHLWWLGQSGFLLLWRGAHVLLDPYLSDSLTRKYAATDKPHTRMTARVIAPERLGFVGLVTASHAHTDHCDPDTLQPLVRANPALRLVGPAAILPLLKERAARDDASYVGLDDGDVTTLGDITISAVPAAHETVERDEAGRCLYLGFVLKLGPWTIYHSGDTVLYEGMAERLRPHAPDIALLPINGRAPERRVAGNLDGPEAARLAHAIGAGLAIPCHYDMFSFNTASPDAFVAEARRLGQPFAVLQNGERRSLTVGTSRPAQG